MKSKSCWLNVECSSVTHFTTSFLFSGQDPGRNPPLRRLVRIDTILSRAGFPEQPVRRARNLDEGAVIQPTTSRKNRIGVWRPWLERIPRRRARSWIRRRGWPTRGPRQRIYMVDGLKRECRRCKRHWSSTPLTRTQALSSRGHVSRRGNTRRPSESFNAR